ncbi:MAG: NAD(P)-dependent oxidoreductase, partial [Pseudomonadota bacterium]|nr:NAD(P)-dependent oxidoreductase [Pseudomonadota bacterium]
ETKNMMGAKQFAQMKDGSIFINAARGTVVEIDAMVEALESGKLLGGAVDVFPVEPKNNDDEFVSPLRQFDNVILTPHIGGSTVEAQQNIGLEVSEKIIRYSDNGSTITSVNMPEVSLPAHSGKHRLIHIHQNVPGILGQINSILSENNTNIAAQYLRTKGDIGYVVIDIDQDSNSEQTLRMLADIEGTIKTRVLF